MQDLPSSLMQSNNNYLIDSATNNGNIYNNSNPSSNNSVKSNLTLSESASDCGDCGDCDIDIMDTNIDINNNNLSGDIHSLTTTLGANINLTNFVFTHPNYSNHNNCCDQFDDSLCLMSTPHQSQNNASDQSSNPNLNPNPNPNPNSNSALEVPSFLHDLSNQSNQSIQSNISSISSISNTSNNTLPRLQPNATYNTSISSTISMVPTFQMNDSNNMHQPSFLSIIENMDDDQDEDENENEINITIVTIPRALISYILSFLSSVQVIKVSVINIQFYVAIKDEGAAFEKLDAVFWNKIFNSIYHPNDITYFKRFKAVKYIQMISGQLKDFIVGQKEKKEDFQINKYYQVFWSCFNRLEKLEFTLNTNDNKYNHNELILNSLRIITTNTFTIKELILHNICVGNALFDIIKDVKTLNALKLIGNITFENDTFDNNLWLFDNFDKLRSNIYQIENVQLLFKNMHFIPYLFILLFYHKNIKSLSYEFEQSHIMDKNNLMSLNDEYISIILQKCAASIQIKELNITPHLFCDLDQNEDKQSISLMIEQMFYYHNFKSLQILKLGDWNSETWISFVSDYDYKRSMQFIINHYQTLSKLEFNNKIGNNSLLNASIWEPLNFLYNIYSQNYQFDIDNTLDEISKNKLQIWCKNTLRSFIFQIGETDNTLNELIDEHKDEMIDNNDDNIYLQQFNFAKYEWLNDIKSKISLLIEYFKENNINHSIELSFIGGNQVLIAQQIFSKYFNNKQVNSKHIIQ